MADDPRDDQGFIALLERTLADRAGGAYASPDLAVRARNRRRRTVAVRATSAAAALTVAGLSVVVVPALLSDERSTEGDVSILQAPAEGWRWETYRGIELEVPEDWGYGTSGQPWCADDGDARPYVGRPEGMLLMVACEPATAPAEQRVPYLWFGVDAAPTTVDLGDGWVQETLDVGGQLFTVLTDDLEEREHIIDSAHVLRAASDGNGCVAEVPVASDPEARPAAAAGLPPADLASGATICVYDPAPEPAPMTPPLLASDRLTTADARALMAAVVRERPTSADPTVPQCFSDTEDPPSNWILVVRVDGPDGSQDVFVRAAGCGRLAVDDGSASWTAGADVAALLSRGSIGKYVPTPSGETAPFVS